VLFKNYNQIKYNLNGKELTLSDIFKHVSFKDVELSNAYYDYYIEDGESPEIVSLKFYGTTEYSWLVLLVNGIFDFQNEWFESQSEFKRKLDLNYGGDAFYIGALPNIEPGDVMVKVTSQSGNFATDVQSSAYRHIAGFDPVLRKIRGIDGGGTFESGDNVIFARKENNGSITTITFSDKSEEPEETDFTDLIFIEPYSTSLDYFFTSNNIVLNPYRAGITGYNVDTSVTYLDEGTTGNNFAVTLLYKYGACGGTPVSGSIKKQIIDGITSKYYERQKIRVLRQEYLVSVLDLIDSALASNQVGNTFKIIV
jgi:hypothetical protein